MNGNLRSAMLVAALISTGCALVACGPTSTNDQASNAAAGSSGGSAQATQDSIPIDPGADSVGTSIHALRKFYLGRGIESADPDLQSAGWKEVDEGSSLGVNIYKNGNVKIRVEYYPTGLGQIIKITRVK